MTSNAKRDQAFALQQKGDFQSAERLWIDVLEQNPNDIVALGSLGVLAFQTGRNERSEQLLIQARQLDSKVAAVHGNLGAVLMNQSRLADALICLDEAIRLDPGYVPAHINRALLFVQQNRRTAALNSCHTVLQLWPRHIDAHSLRIKVLLDLKQMDRALDACDELIALHPQYAGAYLQRGHALAYLERTEEALTSYEKVISLDPMHAVALERRGAMLLKLWRHGEALQACDHAIKLYPEMANPHAHRGGALRELGDIQEAKKSCDRAIELDPFLTAAYINRAAALGDMGRSDEALVSYCKAIELQRDCALARFGAALACLRMGQWERGWALYEWRTQPGGPIPRRMSPKPEWRGREDLHGKTLFVHCEQGLGDTIQFCRYVDLLASLGAKVILEVQPELVSLFATFEGASQVVTPGRTLEFDYLCSLMSLPHIFKTNLSTVPARVPYIKSSAEKIVEWQKKLGPKKRPRVGLVWAGGFRPNQPETWSTNSRRNIALLKMAPLRSDAIEFYSLQKGQPAESELTDARSKNWDGPRLIDVSHLLHDFSDTAALMHELDLVISVDTSTAHLAGALGKRVWILNRFDSCWRWLTDREDTPWYPTARLYRQDKFGEWEGVIHKVASDLEKFAQGLF